MMNEKIVKNQKALDYITYMMVGSYFTGAKCVSHVQEKRLFLFYKDISVNNQYKLEEKCISFVEKKMKKELPEYIWKENVKVSMKADSTSVNQTEIMFIGSGWRLSVYSEFIPSMNVRITYDFEIVSFLNKNVGRKNYTL